MDFARLLRVRRERPRGCCAAQCEYEFSPSDVDCHATLPPEVVYMQGRYHALAKERTMLLRCESLEPPMSQMGHERRFRYLRGTSAYPPRLAVKADISDRQVRANSRHGLWFENDGGTSLLARSPG